MKTRLLGAFVLIALIVIFVPMFFSSNPSAPQTATAGGDQSVSLAIPPAQDSNLQTRTMSLTPGAPTTSGSAVAPAAATTAAATVTPAQGNQLATVNIDSRRPTDVGTDAAAPKPQPTGPAMGSGASPSQPVIPLQAAGGPPATPGVPPKAPKPTATTPVASTPVATAPAAAAPAAAVGTGPAHGIFVLNLSAYANASSVDHLVRKVRGLGYPVLTRIITQAGKQLTLVTAGPFDSQAAAEAARLKITQSVPGVPATLVSGLGRETSDNAPTASRPVAAAATPTAAPRAGGFAVQLAALGSEADANALRDKLRAAGFDGFVDSMSADGKRLWRVRAGPQAQHADAERVRDQIKAKLGISGNVVSVP